MLSGISVVGEALSDSISALVTATFCAHTLFQIFELYFVTMNSVSSVCVQTLRVLPEFLMILR